MRAFALSLGARAERAASPGDFERRRAAVRAAGVARAVRRRVAARAGATCSPRTSSASRVSGGTASPAICRSCSCTSPAAEALPLVRQVLQAQEYWRLKGLRADVVILNDEPRRLPRRHADAAHGAARRGPVASLAAAARRAPTCCAATTITGRRAHAARGRRARGAERRARRTARAARPAVRRTSTLAALTTPRSHVAAETRPTPARSSIDSPLPFRRSRSATALAASPTTGATYVIVLDGDQETPAPWANVIANPGFGTIVTASGVVAHVGREQPREPADVVRERPGGRSDRRSVVHSRRRDGRDLVADARPRAARQGERPRSSFATPPA